MRSGSRQGPTRLGYILTQSVIQSMKSARIVQTKEPLQITDLSTPIPRNDQVLVSVESAGVCHSDLHLWEGGYAGPQGVFMKVEDRGVKFPLTPGHEIAGIVKEIGDSV